MMSNVMKLALSDITDWKRSLTVEKKLNGRISVDRCVFNCRVIVQQLRAFKAFYDRSGVGAGKVIGVTEPGCISDG